jgi:phosphomannomutase
MIEPRVFKAYDIRGVVPGELNEEVARQIGRGFAEFLKPSVVAVGRDMRLSSPDIHRGLLQGLAEQGTDVVDLGLVSTDGLYFAVGKFGYDAGIMITASHNPPQYNGLKMCEREAIPLSGDHGLQEIREIIEKGAFSKPARKGRVRKQDISAAYADHVLSFIDLKKIKPLTVVIDAGNGMAGAILPEVMKRLPCKVIPMYFELDGSFPNHLASPIEPENIADLCQRVREEKADLGAAFDGDADRMFLVDERANPLGGDMVTALVAKNLLSKEKGATILYNLICSKAVPETIVKCGGRAIRTRVGHALIKPLMRRENAVFGGEHSGHFYFRNNWYADSGLIALLVCLELFSQEAKPVSELVASLDPYVRTGEINTPVDDIPRKLLELEHAYATGRIDKLDGITIDYGDWWFNVRPSNTEPLLRLNLEAKTKSLMGEKRDEVLKLIRGHA